MNRPLRILHTEAAKGMGGQEIYIFRHMQVMRARVARRASGWHSRAT